MDQAGIDRPQLECFRLNVNGCERMKSRPIELRLFSRNSSLRHNWDVMSVSVVTASARIGSIKADTDTQDADWSRLSTSLFWTNIHNTMEEYARAMTRVVNRPFLDHIVQWSGGWRLLTSRDQRNEIICWIRCTMDKLDLLLTSVARHGTNF